MPSSSESNSLEKNNRNRREERKESTIQFLPGFLPAASPSPGPSFNVVLWQKPPASFADHLCFGVGAGERQTQVSVCHHEFYAVLTLLPASCLGLLLRTGPVDI